MGAKKRDAAKSDQSAKEATATGGNGAARGETGDSSVVFSGDEPYPYEERLKRRKYEKMLVNCRSNCPKYSVGRKRPARRSP